MIESNETPFTTTKRPNNPEENKTMSNKTPADTELSEKDGTYIKEHGKTIFIPKDPDDTTRGIRVPEEVYEAMMKQQKSMRKSLNGFKPDIHTIGVAIIEAGLRNEKEVIKNVKGYVLRTLQTGDQD